MNTERPWDEFFWCLWVFFYLINMLGVVFFSWRKQEIIGRGLLLLFVWQGWGLDPLILPSLPVTSGRVLKLYIPDYTSTIFCPGMMKGFAYYDNNVKNPFGTSLV